MSEEPFGDKSLKLDVNRLAQMESQLMRLRQLLFEAKDQVLDALTESVGQKMREAARAYRTDLVMKTKLADIASGQVIDHLLNKSVKTVKQVVV